MLVLNYIIFTLFIIRGFTHSSIIEENLLDDYDYYDDFPKELNILNYNKNNDDDDDNLSLEQIKNICVNFNDRLVIINNDRTINCKSLKIIKKRESNLNDLEITTNINEDNITDNYTTINDENINTDNSNIDSTTISTNIETTIETTPATTTKLMDNNSEIDIPTEIDIKNKSKTIESIPFDSEIQPQNHILLETDKTISQNDSITNKNVSLIKKIDPENKIEIKMENKTIIKDIPVNLKNIPTGIQTQNQTILKTENNSLTRNSKNVSPINEISPPNQTEITKSTENKTTIKDGPLIINLTIPEIPIENNKTTKFHPKTAIEVNPAEKSMIKPEDTIKINDTKLAIGESEEPAEPVTKAASKDTSILIFLFVAVLSVGILAFAYNFIKKRKRQAADLERVERHNNEPTKRNLPEVEPQEMKPLMTPQPNQKQSDDENNKNGDLNEN